MFKPPLLGKSLSPNLNIFGNPLPYHQIRTQGQNETLAFLPRKHIVWVALFLLLLSLISAAGITAVFYPALLEHQQSSADTARNIGFGAGVFGFSLAFLTAFYPHYAKFTAPVYACAGGVFMSGLALALEARFPYIALQSVFLTVAIFFSLLMFYATGLIEVTKRLYIVVYTATSAIALVYLAGFLLLLFDISLPFLHDGGTGAVLWFGFIVIIASLNLLTDFDRIKRLEGRKQPTYMAWYTGLGLMISLVWLYISVLRLLRAIRR